MTRDNLIGWLCFAVVVVWMFTPAALVLYFSFHWLGVW